MNSDGAVVDDDGDGDDDDDEGDDNVLKDDLISNYSRTSRYGHLSNTDTSVIRTPLYYGQFPMSRQNSHIFSLKIKPYNTDSL